jgi:uncharacterized membrane protein YoaK (UPF0700 family)
VASAAALAAFLIGAAAGGALATRVGEHRGHRLAVGSSVSLALLASALVVAVVIPAPYAGAGRYVLLTLLAVGLGVQNATARAIGVPDATTTVLTLTLTGLAADVTLPGGPPRVARRILSVLAMLAGAFCGALLVLRTDPAWAVAAATAVLLAVAASAIVLARGTTAADWTAPPTPDGLNTLTCQAVRGPRPRLASAAVGPASGPATPDR